MCVTCDEKCVCPTLYICPTVRWEGIYHVQPHVPIQFAMCGCLCVPGEYFCCVNVIEMCSKV